MLTPFLLDNCYSLCTIIIFAYVSQKQSKEHNAMVGQSRLTLPYTARAIKHDKTKTTGERVVDRTAPGVWVAVLPQGAPRWLFGVFLLLQMFILSWSSAYCFKCSSYHSTIIQHMCNIQLELYICLEWNHWLIQTEKEAFNKTVLLTPMYNKIFVNFVF